VKKRREKRRRKTTDLNCESFARAQTTAGCKRNCLGSRVRNGLWIKEKRLRRGRDWGGRRPLSGDRYRKQGHVRERKNRDRKTLLETKAEKHLKRPATRLTLEESVIGFQGERRTAEREEGEKVIVHHKEVNKGLIKGTEIKQGKRDEKVIPQPSIALEEKTSREEKRGGARQTRLRLGVRVSERGPC